MKPVPLLVLFALSSASIGAQAGDAGLPAERPTLHPNVDLTGLAPERDSFGRPLRPSPRPSSFARALDEAWKKDADTENLKAWSEVLARCQQATNPAWSTALVRSEAQQDHCFRY